MLYWPVVASAPQPSARTAARVAAYMKQGGTIVFDTRDALNQRPGDAPTPETQWLRAFSKGLDIPELEVVPRDHVITKTFYLLDGFVGRYASGETWVEALPPEPKDERRGRSAPRTASRRSSSPPMISPPPGPSTSAASRCFRSRRAARVSASWRCAAGSIS